MIRAVLDTNTFVSAVINVQLSVSQEIYQNFIDKHFLLIVSPPLLAEVDEVLHRKRVMKFHKRSPEKLQEIMNQLTSLSYIVPGNTKVDIVRDPDDNKILSAGVEGQANYIVTRDEDLLDLKKYQRIKIITPEDFMGILRSEK
jgi:putative PIN family toxin of toxin-antitoxin system